jgi:DNA-binding MarR family transcriptional regulator
MALIDTPDRTRVRAETETVDLTHALERLLMAGIGITTLALGQVGGASDLTLSQWRVLVIASRAERLRVGELAAHLGVSVPSASRIVRRIERRGLLSASRADDDRRATILRLTTAGTQVVDDVMGRRRQLIAVALREGPSMDKAADHVVASIADRLSRFA